MRTNSCFHYWAIFLMAVRNVMVKMICLNFYYPGIGDCGTTRLVAGF
jgi:hypothetical protein